LTDIRQTDNRGQRAEEQKTSDPIHFILLFP
jgi:hypothetical protein